MKLLAYVEDLKTIGSTNYVNKRKNKYLNFIKENKFAKNIFIRESMKINKYENKNIQVGGDAIFGIVMGSLALIGLSYGIYKYLHRPKCKIEYPLLDVNNIPRPIDILIKILPKSFINKFNESENLLKDIYNEIKIISEPLEFLSEDTTGKKILVESLKITASIGADIITFGAGGDIIISLLFTLKNVLDVILKTISGLVKILEDVDATRLIYDILNINFTSGPFGVKCWIKYILKEYGSDSQAYSLICEFVDVILEKLSMFIGNALGSMIPDSAGLPGLLIPIIIENMKTGAVKYVEKKLMKYYKKIPRRYKVLIQNPKAFKQFLDKKISSKKTRKNIYKYIGKERGQELIETIVDNTGMFAYGIHKGFSLMFSIMDIIVNCRE